MDFKHESVLLQETIEYLEIKPDGIYVDGTLGGGGHSREILRRLDKGKLIAIDRDMDAIKAASIRLKDFNNAMYIHGNYKDIKDILKKMRD